MVTSCINSAFVNNCTIGISTERRPGSQHHQRSSRRRPPSRIQVSNSAAAPRPYSSSPSDQKAASASANVNTPPPPNADEPVWETLAGCQVVTVPSATRPVAVVRFTGGFAAGIAPRALYGRFLEEIARRGNVAIVAAPVNPSFDHLALAADASEKLGDATRELVGRWDMPWIPTFGMGHSLGAKVQLLANCDEDARQALGPTVANLFLAFNNYTAKQSIPMWDAIQSAIGEESTAKSIKELSKVADFLRSLDLSGLADSRSADSVNQASDVLKKVGDTMKSFASSTTDEFTPTPDETLQLVRSRYNVPENLLISFSRDTLSQNEALEDVLCTRFGARSAVIRKLEGTHVTPLTPNLGTGEAPDFAGVGIPGLNDQVRKAAGGVSTELNATVAVVVAFLRLHLEVLAEKRMLP